MRHGYAGAVKTEMSRIEELRRRVQLDPASIAFAALAEEYRRLGRCEEAVEICRAGLARHPAYVSARVTLGRALLDLDRLDDAREELEHALRLAPQNVAAVRALAEIHAKNRQRPVSATPGGSDQAEAPPAAGSVPPAPDPPSGAAPPRAAAGRGPGKALSALEALLAAIVRVRVSPDERARPTGH